MVGLELGIISVCVYAKPEIFPSSKKAKDGIVSVN